MRQIDVDTDVFAAIWSHRMLGENDENQILRRLLEVSSSEGHATLAAESNFGLQKEEKTSAVRRLEESEMGKIRWVDDVRAALTELGGHASLYRIYQVVKERRRAAGRSVPRTLEATIRRTLEDHSVDSANFRGVDLFRLLGRGEWGLK